MLTASQLLHAAAGSPPVASCAALSSASSHPCWLCGGAAIRSAAVADWLGDNFTAQPRVACPASDRVCEACVWVCARASGVPGRPAKEGKSPPNMRNFSHLFDAGAVQPWVTASKGEKPVIRNFLQSQKRGAWFAAVADSGQKHVAPFAPVNPTGSRGGVILFEEAEIVVPGGGAPGWAIVDATAALLTAGATKEEVGRGDYGPRSWQLCGPQVRAYEAAWGARQRGSAWFSLALWLAQRDEAEVAERMEREKVERAEKKALDAAADKRERATRGKTTTKTTTKKGAKRGSTIQQDTSSEPTEADGGADRAPTLFDR